MYESKLKNSEIIKRGNDSLLSTLDRQRRYLLRMWSVRKACPNCATMSNYWEGAGIGIDDVEFGIGEPKFTCPGCKRELKHAVPLIGADWLWHLVPIKLETETDGAKS